MKEQKAGRWKIVFEMEWFPFMLAMSMEKTSKSEYQEAHWGDANNRINTSLQQMSPGQEMPFHFHAVCTRFDEHTIWNIFNFSFEIFSISHLKFFPLKAIINMPAIYIDQQFQLLTENARSLLLAIQRTMYIGFTASIMIYEHYISNITFLVLDKACVAADVLAG